MTEYHVLRRNGVVGCEVHKDRIETLHSIGLHSSDGFEMGYEGSGPSDLALTILCNYLGLSPDPEPFKSDESEMGDLHLMAWSLHHAFKRRFIEPHHNNVRITSEQIDEFIAKEEQSYGRY